MKQKMRRAAARAPKKYTQEQDASLGIDAGALPRHEALPLKPVSYEHKEIYQAIAQLRNAVLAIMQRAEKRDVVLAQMYKMLPQVRNSRGEAYTIQQKDLENLARGITGLGTMDVSDIAKTVDESLAAKPDVFEVPKLNQPVFLRPYFSFSGQEAWPGGDNKLWPGKYMVRWPNGQISTENMVHRDGVLGCYVEVNGGTRAWVRAVDTYLCYGPER